jgi:hypothetical protein
MELAPSSFRRFGQLTEVISGRIESTSGDATGSIWLKVILAPDGSDHGAQRAIQNRLGDVANFSS